MKKKILITTIILMIFFIAVMFIISYEEYPSKPTKWIVNKIEQNTSTTSLYLAIPTESKDLNLHSTWFVDSIGRYNTGDTIAFKIYKNAIDY